MPRHSAWRLAPGLGAVSYHGRNIYFVHYCMILQEKPAKSNKSRSSSKLHVYRSSYKLLP
ncbi:unnamed protein product [Amoebophrya sp. A120]|nr:unnamed protein product [Amoebophrya sp. A120]|eukprot:GSA120T00020525001.1